MPERPDDQAPDDQEPKDQEPGAPEDLAPGAPEDQERALEAPPPEMPRPVVLARVPAAGRALLVEADAAERDALAARMGILAVESLRAELRLVPEEDGSVLVTGQLRAAVVQECVMTLEPVPQAVSEPVALRLLPDGREPADGPDDPWDEITAQNGTVDVGEAMAEQLALALDPYPRAPGAELPPEATDAPPNPFAALAALKRQKN